MRVLLRPFLMQLLRDILLIVSSSRRYDSQDLAGIGHIIQGIFLQLNEIRSFTGLNRTEFILIS